MIFGILVLCSEVLLLTSLNTIMDQLHIIIPLQPPTLTMQRNCDGRDGVLVCQPVFVM